MRSAEILPSPSTRLPAADLGMNYQAAAALAFERAARRAGVEEHHFRVAGQVMRLRFVGPALVPKLIPALEHLRVQPQRAGLTAQLWDEASTGVALPPPPRSLDRYLPRGKIKAVDHPNLRSVLLPGAKGASLCDVAINTAYYWMAGAAHVVYWESAAPLRNIIHAWLGGHGIQLVHAAALGTEDGAVLLAGKGGSGKSTTSLFGLADGLHYLGDDFCLVSTEATEATVHSLYSSAKINADNLHRIPALRVAVSNPDRLPEEKAIFYFAKAYGGQLPACLPLKAILIPRDHSSDPRIVGIVNPPPLVSVVIPVYNGESYLAEALQSIQSQTLPPSEILVVDDGSSKKIARSFPSVRCVSIPHGGISVARNRGVKAARAEYLAFLDSDDLWVPEKLEWQSARLAEDPGAGFCSRSRRTLLCRERRRVGRGKVPRPSNRNPGYLAGTLLIRRSPFLKVGYFDESLRLSSFIDWYLRAVDHPLRSVRMEEVVLRRRVHGENTEIVQRTCTSSDAVTALKKALDRRRRIAGNR
jgi:hypothetical protein